MCVARSTQDKNNSPTFGTEVNTTAVKGSVWNQLKKLNENEVQCKLSQVMLD